MAHLVSIEDGTQSGPAAELGDSLCMASIMISSFNLISVKNILWLMSVIGSWQRRKQFWVRSGKDTSKQHISYCSESLWNSSNGGQYQFYKY